jgi:hypothetical protein
MQMNLQDIERAQQAWGEGIVSISAAHSSGADYIQRATTHIESLYAYGICPVLFKPTFASEKQFRSTFEGALSYFIGDNDSFSEDKGFAIKGWKGVRFENQNFVFWANNTAQVMGNYFFMTENNIEIKVEFTFGYMMDSEGSLRIYIHHSSMPAIIE